MAPPERPRAPRPTGSGPSGPRRAPAAGGAKPPYRRREDDAERKPYQRRDGAPAARGPRRDDGERKPYQRRDGAPAARGPRRDDGERKPYQRRDGAPAARGPRRDDGERKPYQRRDDGERKPYQRRDGAPAARGPRRGDGERKPYQRRDDGERKPYQRRDDGEGKPYQRRDGAPAARGPRRDDGERKPYQRRDDGERKPYQRRDGAPAARGPRRDDGERKPYQRRDDRGAPPRREAPVEIERPTPKGWGGVTRRGARQVTNPTPLTDEAKAYERRESAARSARPTADQWEREPRPVPAPRARKKPAVNKQIRAKALPADVVKEVASAAPSARRAPMLQKRLGDAARHMQHGRDQEAASILRELAQEVPEAASVRELYGQVLYSLGRYKQAVGELEAFVALTASTDQHPMLADSYRALGRHKKVAELWADLKESSPAPDIVAEGRIVAAGSLADQGKLDDGIRLLETAPPVRGRVHDRHLRTWFALADLYERSGELSKARAGFQRVKREDPEFVDIDDRLRALG